MSQRWQLVVGILGGSLGAVLLFAGLAVLLGEIVHYVETVHWRGYSLLELVKSPIVKSAVPGALQAWLYGPEYPNGVQAAVVEMLETVPTFVFLMGLGGLILRKALK